MSHIKDDWSKPRSEGNKLTQAEIAKIRVAFNCGRHQRDIARELQCSSRTAAKYFAIFRGGAARTGRPSKETQREKAPERRPVQRARFYTSNFEL